MSNTQLQSCTRLHNDSKTLPASIMERRVCLQPLKPLHVHVNDVMAFWPNLVWHMHDAGQELPLIVEIHLAAPG